MSRAFILAACFSAAFSLSAHAHPGSKLLTMGNGERTAMSGTVTFEEAGGVHLFKGGSIAKETELLGGETRQVKKTVKVKLIARPFRSIRRLRTQGFYSGVAYPSRAYTQGFYSSGR